jgi:hypothetical protein
MKIVKAVVGTVLFAATTYAILAAPGLLDDSASTVPARVMPR